VIQRAKGVVRFSVKKRDPVRTKGDGEKGTQRSEPVEKDKNRSVSRAPKKEKD